MIVGMGGGCSIFLIDRPRVIPSLILYGFMKRSMSYSYEVWGPERILPGGQRACRDNFLNLVLADCR